MNELSLQIVHCSDLHLGKRFNIWEDDLWPEFSSNGIIAIGWDKLGDLRQYSSLEDLEKKSKLESIPRQKISCFKLGNISKDLYAGNYSFISEGEPVMSSLLDLLKETLKLVEKLEGDLLRGIESMRAEYSIFFKVFSVNMTALQSVSTLVTQSKYRSCFIVLRSIFESYFYLLLMLEGRKFRETKEYRIIPDESHTEREARDRTFEKWWTEWKAGKPQYRDIVAINKGHENNVIHVTYEIEGMFLEGSKGEVLPIFYFAFEEYNPYLHYLTNLPTVSVGFFDEDEKKQFRRKHSDIYSQYLYIERIARNLKLNDLLTPEQVDRFWVHYNFLSSFTHLTKVGLLDKEEIATTEKVSDLEVDEALFELVLLYSCSLMFYYLSSMSLSTLFIRRRLIDKA